MILNYKYRILSNIAPFPIDLLMEPLYQPNLIEPIETVSNRIYQLNSKFIRDLIFTIAVILNESCHSWKSK